MKIPHIQWILALAASVTASAQPPRPPQGDRRPPPVPPLFAIFDLDRDKVLSADEIATASDALKKLDKDGDGEITLDELRMPPPDGKERKGPGPGRPPVPPLIAALDADKDGTISAEELANAPESLKALDKNSDGALSPEELRPGRPQGPPPEMEEEAGE